MLDQIEKLCLSHFLCQFNPKSRKRLTSDVVREIALSVFSDEKVNEFIDDRLVKFQQLLVEEFNERYRDKRPLRFQIVDTSGVGEIVAGYQRKKLAKETRFQDALHKTAPEEFEKLAGVVLKVLGCTDVFSTPSSHDQGIDAFGTVALVPPTPLRCHAWIDVDRAGQTLPANACDDW